jgi:hypothetical protein
MCPELKQIKPSTHKQNRKLQLLLTPIEPWANIAMEFVIGLLTLCGRKGSGIYDAIIMIVDRYTKFASYYPSTSNITTPQLADIIARKLVLCSSVIPLSIVTDLGSEFTSLFRTALCYLIRIEHWLSTTYYPQTNG